MSNEFIMYMSNDPERRWTVNRGMVDTLTTSYPLKLRMGPGLCQSESFSSYEAVEMPGMFVRQSASRVKLQANDGSATFGNDSCFRQTPGLCGQSDMKSFAAFDRETAYIHRIGNELWVNDNDGTPEFGVNACFSVQEQGDTPTIGNPSLAAVITPEGREAPEGEIGTPTAANKADVSTFVTLATQQLASNSTQVMTPVEKHQSWCFLL